MRLARALLGWCLYACSAAPFVVFVILAFTRDGEASSREVAINAAIFAAAGVTAVAVKNMAFNAVMALDAIPYASFLLARHGIDPALWSANDVEGSVAYVSLYAMLGMVSTVIWTIYALTRRRRHSGKEHPRRTCD